jgi:hypothetical protein
VKKKPATRPGLVRFVGKTESSMKDSYLSAILLSSCRTRLSSFSIALLSCSIARLTLSPRTSELLLSRARRPYIAAFCRLMARFAWCEFLCKR